MRLLSRKCQQAFTVCTRHTSKELLKYQTCLQTYLCLDALRYQLIFAFNALNYQLCLGDKLADLEPVGDLNAPRPGGDLQ